MKKSTAALLTVILFISLTSCSTAKSSDEEVKAEPETSASSSVSSGTETEPESREFDISEMTAGKITKISGNQVTLELGTIDKDSIEMPSMPEAGSAPDGESSPDMPEDVSAPENMPEDFDPDNLPEGMTKPENMPEGSAGFSGSVTAEISYTGETARYTIPAEVKVGSGDYTSLSKGDVIALGFDDDGTVSSVMLITEKGSDS